jgi:hypothetical protein
MGTAGDTQSRNRLMNSEVVSKVMTAARSPCVHTYDNDAHSSAALVPDLTSDRGRLPFGTHVNSSALVEQFPGVAFLIHRRQK